MSTELELSQTTAALYAPQPGDFDTIVDAPWVMGVKRLDEYHVQIVCRGSVTEQDFLDDIHSEFGEIVRQYPELGELPLGFARELSGAAAVAAIHLASTDTPVFTGHSLGAARACLLAGAYVVRTGKPCRVQALGCPRPGTSRLSFALAGSEVRLYRNGADPVWDVPVPLPLLRWEHPGATTKLSEEPDAKARVGSFGDELWHTIPGINWHQIALYLRGIERLEHA